MREVQRLVGNRAIEDAAIDWIMELERLAGRAPVDRRHVATFAGDVWSDPHTIEVKAVGGSARGYSLPLESSQFEAAGTDPNFVLDVVENVAQGDPTKFVHHRFEGTALHRLVGRGIRRTYFEVPVPVEEYDAAPRHPSLAAGPVATRDTRPEWAQALRAARVGSVLIGHVSSSIAAARVEFRRWSGPKLTWQESYGKTPILDADGGRTCAEVEIVARLRQAGWDAWWIDTFGQAPAAWRDSIIKVGDLPPGIRERFLDVDRKVESGHAAGSGRWDIVAARADEVLILESKGAGDQLRPKQLAWLGSALETGWSEASFGIVNYVVRA